MVVKTLRKKINVLQDLYVKFPCNNLAKGGSIMEINLQHICLKCSYFKI